MHGAYVYICDWLFFRFIWCIGEGQADWFGEEFGVYHEMIYGFPCYHDEIDNL